VSKGSIGKIIYIKKPFNSIILNNKINFQNIIYISQGTLVFMAILSCPSSWLFRTHVARPMLLVKKS